MRVSRWQHFFLTRSCQNKHSSQRNFFIRRLLFFIEKKMAALSPLYRNLSTFRVLRSSMAEPLKKDAVIHDDKGWKMWRTLFFVVCLPAIGMSFVNWKLSEESKPPEFKKYSHLRIRNKKYPWRDGVKTLFHNPHTNALPDGYEHH